MITNSQRLYSFLTTKVVAEGFSSFSFSFLKVIEDRTVSNLLPTYFLLEDSFRDSLFYFIVEFYNEIHVKDS